MRVRKLRGFSKLCVDCNRGIWMQEFPDGSWKAFEGKSGLLQHLCIVGDYQ